METRSDTDNSGNVVQDVITVSNNAGDKAIINLYRTNSSSLINGDPSLVTPVLETLSDYISKSNVTLIDKRVKTILDDHIRTMKRPNVDLGAKARICTDDTKCIKCKRQAKTKAVLCEPGNHWVHYNCDRLTPSEIDNLHSGPYICKTCAFGTSKRPYGSMTTACNSDRPTLAQDILHDQAPISSVNGSQYQNTVSDSNSLGSTVCLPTKCVSSPCLPTRGVSSPSILVRATQGLDQQTNRNMPSTELSTTARISSSNGPQQMAIHHMAPVVSDRQQQETSHHPSPRVVPPTPRPRVAPPDTVSSNSLDSIQSENPAKLRQWERKLTKREEAVKHREQASAQAERDLAHTRSYVLKLEEQIKELEHSNRRLHRENLTTNTHDADRVSSATVTTPHQDPATATLLLLLQPLIAKLIPEHKSCSCDRLKDRIENLESDLRYMYAKWDGYLSAYQQYDRSQSYRNQYHSSHYDRRDRHQPHLYDPHPEYSNYDYRPRYHKSYHSRTRYDDTHERVNHACNHGNRRDRSDDTQSVSTHSYQHERHMESEHTTVQRAPSTSSSDIHHSALGDYSRESSIPTTSRTPPPSTTNATPTVLSQPHTKEDDGPEDSTPTERTACASPSPSVAYRRHSSDIAPTQTLSCQSPLYVALPPVVPTSGDPMPAAKSPLYVALPPGVPISGDLASADKNSNTDSCFLDQDRRVSTPRDHSQ